MQKLFSYVVDHDNGYAPNPFGGLCTLAKCKYGSPAKRNVVELAKEGDWVIGTGGASGLKRGESAGVGNLIYAMRIDRKMPLAKYWAAYRTSRIDAQIDYVVREGRFALLSKHFFYFGRNAVSISEIPKWNRKLSLEKKGPGFRSDFDQQFIDQLAKCLTRTFRIGVHGMPCKPGSDLTAPRCLPRMRRKLR
jgi:hypothetical protein